MKFGKIGILSVFFFSCCLFAEVVGTITQPRVYYRGKSEPVGSVTFSVRGNDLAGASQEHPIYLYLDFEMGSVLAETLVDLASGDYEKSAIFLRTTLDTTDASANLNLSENAISIVRWRAGETGIWIKIIEDSGHWIQSDDTLRAPDEEHAVSWTLGINSDLAHVPPRSPNQENRSAISRLNGKPISTEIRLDLSESTIQSSGVASLLSFYPYFYDSAMGVEGGDTVVPGMPLSIVYDGGTMIAMGWDRLGEISYIYPWVSNSSRFESIIVVNNYGSRPTDISLHARRADGSDSSVSRSIPPRGSLISAASELFASLGKGPGYTVEMQATEESVEGRWITYNLATASNRSPSQANAVKWHSLFPNQGDFLGQNVLFGYLPTGPDSFSSPVLVNMGTENADIQLFFFDTEGRLILKNYDLIVGLAPFQPFAFLVSDLIPEDAGDVSLIAVSETNLLTGVTFIFNQAGEPAIGNAQSIQFNTSECE